MTTASTRRLVFWSVVGLLVVVAVAVAMMPRPIPVDVATLVRGPLRVTLDHEGQTRVRERFVVSAPIAGRVLRIGLEPGDQVIKGRTVLATLLPVSPPLLDLRSRAEGTSRVAAASAAVDGARAQRDQAQAASAFATSEARRTRQMLEEGLASRQAAESADAEALVRQRALQAAEAAVAAAAHELEAAQAALVEPGQPSGRSSAGDRAGVVSVLAPVDGVVLRRVRESESVVAQGEPLLEVADRAGLEVIADFLSTDAVQMTPGLPVLIDRWGGAAPLHGRVRRIEPSAFLKVSALGVEEQRVFVVIAFADPPAAARVLGDGYRVEARVVMWEASDVLQVPASALFRHGDGWAVFALQDGRARLRQVEIGHRNGVAAELQRGAQAGDRVIVHPADQVMDGVRVVPR